MPSSSWFHRLFSIVSDVHFLGEVYPAAFLVIYSYNGYGLTFCSRKESRLIFFLRYKIVPTVGKMGVTELLCKASMST